MFLPRGFTSPQRGTRAAEKIKRQVKCLDSWILWIVSTRHSFPPLPFVEVPPLSLTLSHKHVTKNKSSPSPALYAAWGMWANRHKGPWCWFCWSWFAILAAFVFLSKWVGPTRERMRASWNESKWERTIVLSPSFFFWTEFPFQSYSETVFWHGTDRKADREDGCLAEWHSD